MRAKWVSALVVAAVGASGSICGLLTSLGVWLWLNRDYLPAQISATTYRVLPPA